MMTRLLAILAVWWFWPISAWPIDVSQFLACSSGVNDGPALQSMLNAIVGTDIVDFSNLPNRHCYVNQAISWPYQVGLTMGTAVLDFSGAPVNTNDITVTGPANNYAGRTTPWVGLDIIGNGSGVGLLIATPDLSFIRPTIHETNFDIQLGNNAYGDNFEEPSLFNAHNTAFRIPQGLTNAGEQIVIHGGSIFNSSHGLYIGGGRVVIEGTSIDGIASVPVTMNAQCAPGQAAALTITDAHFEEFSNPTGSAWIWLTGCNTYSYLDVKDTEFYADVGTNLPLINDTETWAWGKVENSFFSGFSGVFATGVGIGNVKFCHNTTGGNHPQDDVTNSPNC